MIAPDIETMLAIVFTDATIQQPILQAMLAEANEDTFNSVTVDGDTSTSDTLLLFATGKADNPHPRSGGAGVGVSQTLPPEQTATPP